MRSGASLCLRYNTARQRVLSGLNLESRMIDKANGEAGIGCVAAEQNDPIDIGATGISGQDECVERMLAVSGIEHGCAGAFFDDFEGDSRAPDGLYLEAIGRAP